MTILVQDGFADTADVNITAHTPDTTGTGWTEEENTSTTFLEVLGVTSDNLHSDGNEGDVRMLVSAQPDPTEVEVDVSYTYADAANASVNPVGVFARFADTSNYYSAGNYRRQASPDAIIAKKVANVHTTLASGDLSPNIAAGDDFRFEVKDAAKKLFRNTTEELSTTDNAITAAGKSGVWFGNVWVSTDDVSTSAKIDDFLSEEFAAAGANPKGPLGMPLNRPLGGPL